MVYCCKIPGKSELQRDQDVWTWRANQYYRLGFGRRPYVKAEQENRRHQWKEQLIQWAHQTVRHGSRGHIAGCLKEALDKICSKTQLIEVNRDRVGRDAPCKMNSEKPFHHAHEIHLALLSQEMTE